MKAKNLLTISMIAGVFVFGSCSKDNTPADLSTAEAQTEISSVKTTYDAESTALDNTQGMMAYNQMGQLNLPFSLPMEGNFSTSSYVKSFSNRLSAVRGNNFSSMQKALNFSSDFYFQEYLGTWEWNSQTQQFDHTSTPTDKVVVKFPYPASNSTNNAVYTISKYTIAYDMGEYSGDYQANLILDGTEIWSVNYSASISSTSSSATFSQNVTFKFSPYEYTESASLTATGNESSATISGRASRTLKKNSNVLLSGSYDVSLKYADPNITMSVKGDLTIATIRFHFEMSYSGDGTTQPDINDLVEVTVYNAAGAKVGEMKYITNQNQELVLMFYYNDGTSVDASALFGNVLDEWTSFFGTTGDAWNFKK
ncbi:MAG TPA: hypothetical protein VMW01_09535 [Williamwhitmania sp.]|nr:hypothetical protein [Williamwhitmania sp.]